MFERKISLLCQQKKTMKNKFLVIGEYCQDVFKYGKAKRLSPEAPVPVFIPTSERVNGGMAHNTYRNLSDLFAKSNVGKYVINHFLSDNFSSCVPQKIRYVDEKTNHLFLRVDIHDDAYGSFVLTDYVKVLIENSDHIIISDYDKGFLTEQDIIDIANQNTNAVIYLDTKKLLTDRLLEVVDFVKINESELEENAKGQGWNKTFNRHNHKFIITLGDKGAKWNDSYFKMEQPHRTIDVSGAGDTFMAAFVYYYSCTANIEKSIHFANKIASHVVTKRGVSSI